MKPKPKIAEFERTVLEGRALHGRLAKQIVLPRDASWDTSREAWNLAVDQRPAAVALPETANDVAAVVRLSRSHGLRIAAQGTGHNAAPLGDLADTILVKTSRMRGVAIDPALRLARVEAGVLWIEVTAKAAEHGLAALAGSSPDVGVVGYTLGGGISWLGRKYGLSTNNVSAIEVVTADGELVRADRNNHADLFWALRGGGGSFGVVTAIELELFPIATVHAGWLIWPMERADEVLRAYSEWVETVPDEITSVGRLLRVPPLPDIPEPVRGRELVVVEATYLGDEAGAAELLRPLRALEPELDTFATIPVSTLSKLHMDPEHPVPGIGDGMLLTELSPEAVGAVVDAAGAESGSPLLSVEIRHLGGALARTSDRHGALDRLDAGFAMYAIGVPVTPEIGEAVKAGIARVHAALAPWDARQMYLNFADHAREPGRFHSAGAYGRLREIKARYDRSDVFRSNHPIAPAEARSTRGTTRRLTRPSTRPAAIPAT